MRSLAYRVGTPGKRLQRGEGEIDPVARSVRISFRCTPEDAETLRLASQEKGQSQTQILIDLIRLHLSKYRRQRTSKS